ncbi:MAG TPA: CU044_2847 family protein, partial [Pseudonocardiaceae bacterium]|nr:CU044_2847 family protein [Pseudonocardiaceae bacterium]
MPTSNWPTAAPCWSRSTRKTAWSGSVAAARSCRRSGKTFDESIAHVRDAAAAALHQFQSMTRRPDELEIKFGVKLDAEVGALIARTGVQGQFEV